MELNVKVGNRFYKSQDRFIRNWRDGQIIDVRPDGYYDGCAPSREMNCIIRLPMDFWTLRGDTKWVTEKRSFYDLKKFLAPADSNGKYPWETFYLKNEKQIRERDWFIDFKRLLDDKLIDQATYDSIYAHGVRHKDIVLTGDFRSYLNHEDGGTKRLIDDLHNQPFSQGTKTIGATASDATDIVDAQSKTADQDGNLTWEHKDEATTTGAKTTFVHDTSTFLFKITAVSGAEHDGTGYGNGARIAYGNLDGLAFDEGTAGFLDNVEVSNLAFLGANNLTALALDDGGDATGLKANRLLIDGASGTNMMGINVGSEGNNITMTNNIIHACVTGLAMNTSSRTYFVANNDCMKNTTGFFQDHASVATNLTFKNNLAQGNTTDYGDDGAGYGSVSAKNYGETDSPDSLTENFHDGTSNFVDYTNDNYLIASGGDAIATLKAGEDLTGTFTDDIIDLTRLAATFFIGASWISVAAPSGVKLRTLTLTGAGR